MKEDAVVAEVRKFRDEHAKKFNYDLDAIVRDFRRRERRCPSPVLSRSPRRPTAHTRRTA